jgi:hypothetical protein
MSRLKLATVFALATLLVAAPSSAQTHDHVVLAYYYALWDPDNFALSAFEPQEAYNSDDGAVMERHLQQARSAGIDGLVVSWLGNGDRTDRNLVRLLDLGQRAGVKMTIQVDTPLFWGVEDTTAQLQAFYEQRLDHPAMLKYQGRPVIFFWRMSTYDNGTWSAIRAQVDPGRRALWIADGDNIGVVAGDAWDGISPYAIAWSGDPVGQLGRWGATTQAIAPEKLWIPPVSPGCNDAAIRALTCYRERGGGMYYQATWDGAMASNPSWAVIVSTFNEWLESSQIEPSVQYGTQYLELTRQNADVFHAAP